jgi:hypothetical protein
MLCYGRRLAATDAKHDTTLDRRSMFSSIRTPTPYGWFPVLHPPPVRRAIQPNPCSRQHSPCRLQITVWVAPGENTRTIKLALTATAINVKCSEPDCPHTVIEEFGANGSYRRRLCCTRHWGPPMCHDKHVPTFNAVLEAEFECSILDSYHGFMAGSTFLVKVAFIFDAAAHAIDWAFHLCAALLSHTPPSLAVSSARPVM